MKERRRMPVEKEWFDKNKNDIIYGLLQSIGEQFHDSNGKIQVRTSKVSFIKNLTIIKKCADVRDKRTIMSAISKYAKDGYITEDEDYYYFPYNVNNPYILIDLKLLDHICKTFNKQSLKIYVYLKNKYNMKEKKHEKYLFTIKELKSVLGYSDSTDEKTTGIRNILAEFKNSNIMGYKTIHIDYVNKKGEYKIPNFQLDFVEDELPKKIEENLKEFVF